MRIKNTPILILLFLLFFGSGAAVFFYIDYDREVTELQQKLDREQERASESQVTITKQYQDLNKKDIRHRKLMDDLLTLKSKFDDLNKELQVAEAQLGNSSFLSSRIIGNGIKTDIDHLLHKSDTLNLEHGVLQNNLIEVQIEDLRKLRTTVDKVKEEKEDLIAKLEKMKSQLLKLEAENRKLKGENEAQTELIASLRQSLDSLTLNLNNKTMAYDALSSAALQKDQEIKDLQNDLGASEIERIRLKAFADSVEVELISERVIVSRLAENSLIVSYKMKKGGKEYSVKLDQKGKHKRKKVNRIDIRFHVSHSMIEEPNNELVKVEILDSQYQPVSASLQKTIAISNYRGQTHFNVSRGNRLSKGNYYLKISHNSKKLFFHAFKIN